MWVEGQAFVPVSSGLCGTDLGSLDPVAAVAVVCVEVGHSASCVRVVCLHPQETLLCLAAERPGMSLASLSSTDVEGKQPRGAVVPCCCCKTEMERSAPSAAETAGLHPGLRERVH